MLRAFAIVLVGISLTVASSQSSGDCGAGGSGNRRGCCSHHNGVCGCNDSSGMQRCCDGTDSPSCQCGE